jgi:hypothetical protein
MARILIAGIDKLQQYAACSLQAQISQLIIIKRIGYIPFSGKKQ